MSKNFHSFARASDPAEKGFAPRVIHTKLQMFRFNGATSFLSVMVLASMCSGAVLNAQTPDSGNKLSTGKDIYMAGCVSCHGPHGRGQTQELAGFKRPSTFPDFTDCKTATPEMDVQWRAVISNGGPARAFSPIMPSFKGVLSPEQIDKVIGYLRSLCSDTRWPRGNLNLPRALITEKAFPENEVVVTGSINAHGAPAGDVKAIYEKRIGTSAMIEVSVPYAYLQDSTGTHAAFGDIALGYKQKLYASVRHGSIFSLGGEVIAPTGSETAGTGGESTVFEPFAAFGQILPHNAFLQVHTGFELPVHPDKIPNAYYLHTAIGMTFSSDHGLGRRWSPMAEVIADRDLTAGAKTNWDVVPEIQIPVSKRMHILGDVGLRIPLNNTDDRPKEVMFYLLWDYVDGSLKQGWK